MHDEIDISILLISARVHEAGIGRGAAQIAVPLWKAAHRRMAMGGRAPRIPKGDRYG
uniref:Uncharacterized protein n=1 Tax=Ralstonia solanacearum TaxID=305 RepID=A0A0S4V8S3_RALSL|nr:protein of unknown function [Ralstonia solanacearum]CUV30321.1 protein of unknown function [Ralstonia solanacearum]CUV32759.1 protein of unknown function [Ralstonia solanacearum]CUV38593.1 protein of unknown function [Ralstonia solanacearum]CUV63314.1 protein of unknown function [Ralstonia solanacearum]